MNRNDLTIVTGLPRSGTSMMMRMIEAGGIPAMVDNIRTADADNPRGYYEFEPVKKTKEDPSWVKDSAGKVVKMVYSLVYHMPADQHYRILFMRRKMEEVLASQTVMLKRSGLDDVGGNGEMGTLFAAQLKRFQNWLAEQPNIQTIEVDYNEMLSNPRPQVADICDFLDQGLDQTAMVNVVEPSLYRNRAGVLSPQR